MGMPCVLEFSGIVTGDMPLVLEASLFQAFVNQEAVCNDRGAWKNIVTNKF